jgi:hypothetical protein
LVPDYSEVASAANKKDKMMMNSDSLLAKYYDTKFPPLRYQTLSFVSPADVARTYAILHCIM